MRSFAALRPKSTLKAISGGGCGVEEWTSAGGLVVEPALTSLLGPLLMPLFQEHAYGRLLLRDGIIRFGPATPATVHRDDVGVTHLLQAVRGERGAEASAAIKHDCYVVIGNCIFDVALDDALAEVNRSGDVSARPFGVFARVHEDQFFAGVQPLLHLVMICLLDSLLGVFDEILKTFGVLHSIGLPEFLKITSSMRRWLYFFRLAAGRLALRERMDEIDQVPELIRLHPAFLPWHVALALRQNVEHLAVGYALERVGVAVIQQLELHVFGQIAL